MWADARGLLPALSKPALEGSIDFLSALSLTVAADPGSVDQGRQPWGSVQRV